MKLQDSITSIKGIGPRKAEAFARIGIETVEDMVYAFPRLYEDRRFCMPVSDLKEGSRAYFKGKVDLVAPGAFRQRGKRLLKVLVRDNTGAVEVIFFNGAYLAKAFEQGREYAFFGTPVNNRGRMQVVHPEFERAETARTGILPIYPLTKGITQREMRRIQTGIRPLYEQAEEIIPDRVLAENNLCGIEYAIENVHFPESRERYLEAKYRLIFEEFFVLETGLLISKKKGSQCREGIAFGEENAEEEYIRGLSYELTGAQKRCVAEIMQDLSSNRPMNRLVQGDVGSGKTAVAEIAMFRAVRSGYQAVLMAPTEILARQHFEGMVNSFGRYGIKVGFLSGNMKVSEKRQTLEEVRRGAVDILVGTHAVIQSDVKFNRLGLVITDEQHRFGVNQRILLQEKGNNPNIMVMTATPIPRTLAVVIYGDMDVSVIDEMPPGRKPVITRSVKGEASRLKCYDFVESQIKQGRQAYVVTPLIDQSETMDAKSVQETYEELSKRFPGCALVHGAMKQEEKDAAMDRFCRGETDILVATVVIEVGINVPNATVMVVENAERFGLAQLHQLRGRVGRGRWQSYCFLIQGSESQLSEKRGEIMEKSSDGFYIAEEDLKMRGPGEIFGTRQHGLPDMKIADMAAHMDILVKARDEAKAVLKEDPELKKEENMNLKRKVIKMFGENIALNL